jgi:hypothetical protein
VVANPPSLFSSNGVLAVRFSYQHVFDFANRELFCFMTPDGLQNPTLHVNPGDHLIITVTNNLPEGTGAMGVSAPNCGARSMNTSSLNIHYHGTNTSPTCQQDEVIKTLINPHETFQYNVAFPPTNRRDFIGTIRMSMALPSTRSWAEPRVRSLSKASKTCSRP